MTDSDPLLAGNCKHCGILHRHRTEDRARQFERYGCRSCRTPLVLLVDRRPPPPLPATRRTSPSLYELLMRERELLMRERAGAG